MNLSSKLAAQAPNARRLFLVRHGEVIPPGGVHGVHYGDMDVPLSPLGKDEASAAAAFLKPSALSSVFSSPLSRAVYGAEEIRKGRSNLRADVPATFDGFSELKRGAWRGKSKEDIGADLYDAFNRGEDNTTPKDGESVFDVRKRVLEARDEVLGLIPDGEAGCVVSHLWVTRSFLSEALNVGAGEMHELAIPTASISCVDYVMGKGGNWEGNIVMTGFKPEAGLRSGVDLGN